MCQHSLLPRGSDSTSRGQTAVCVSIMVKGRLVEQPHSACPEPPVSLETLLIQWPHKLSENSAWKLQREQTEHQAPTCLSLMIPIPAIGHSFSVHGENCPRYPSVTREGQGTFLALGLPDCWLHPRPRSVPFAVFLTCCFLLSGAFS